MNASLSLELKAFVSNPFVDDTCVSFKDPSYPKITIVTPSYSQAEFLERTILSVLNQNYPNLEYIIIDGGSVDKSVDIIKKYEKYLDYWTSEPDRGQAHAVNKGWARANGEILGWLNSDDLLLPGSLRKIASAFLENPEAVIVYGESYYVDHEDHVIRRFETEPFSRELFREICYICQPSVFFHNKVIGKIGMLDEGLKYCMDYDFWIRASNVFNFTYIREFLAGARVHGESKTMSSWVNAAREDMQLMKRHFGTVDIPVIYRYSKAIVASRVGISFPFAIPMAVIMALFQYIAQNRKLPRYSAAKWSEWAHRLRRSNKKDLDIHYGAEQTGKRSGS
jgi:glycosyltransferase involved in cell wall biosynthesis